MRIPGRPGQHHNNRDQAAAVGALAMRNLNTVVAGGGHSDSTSVSEDDSTGAHSWSSKSRHAHHSHEEPIYNSVPEEQLHSGGEGLLGRISDRSERNMNGEPCTPSGFSETLSSNVSRDDDIMVPKYSRSLCTPSKKNKTVDLSLADRTDSDNGLSLTGVSR